MISTKRQLSLFGLVMINVIAIDSLRTLPLGAVYGFSLVFFYLVAAAMFFVPTALVSAELATGWPEHGGLYIWVREAFGKKIGFVAIWLQWFYNICWYPTIMSFIVATLAYCIDPSLVESKFHMLMWIIGLFWMCTFANFAGIRVSSSLSTFSAIAGTLFPMLFIIGLAACWYFSGRPLQIEMGWKHLIPDVSNIQNLVFLTVVLYGYVGIEMSAAHAGEVKNPQRNYPKALLWSTIIICSSLMLASLAIAMVVPHAQLSVIAGLVQAYDIFFQAFHIKWFTQIMALLIVVGSLGGVNAWILGPAKSLWIASQDGCLPSVFTHINRQQVPTHILLIQGVLFTLFCSVFVLLPSVASGFWVLSDVASILSLFVYVILFVAAIRLRQRYPNKHRAFRIPGGNIGLYLVCGLGLFSALFTIAIGFIPPSQIQVGNLAVYESILVMGVVVGTLLPLMIYRLSASQHRS